jgi:hypothetical protein
LQTAATFYPNAKLLIIMGSHLAPFAVSLLSLSAATASAQTLLVEKVTTSTRPTAAQPFNPHTEHARPAAWKPLAVTGRADLTVTVEYDINVTNTSSVAELAECGLQLSDAFITDNLCWGVDPSSPMLNLFVSETVPANSVTRLTGLVVIDQFTFPYFACQFVDGDPVHTTLEDSALFTGPSRTSVNSNEWFASPFGPAGQFLSVEDLGTSIRNDLSFAMTHDLPLIAGSNGCEPLRPNSTGVSGRLEAFGALDVAQPATVLRASQLPANTFGLFALSSVSQPPVLAGFGGATLCLASPLVRWFDSIGTSDSSGSVELELPTSSLPVPNGQVLAGDTWFFQYFHRDTDPMTSQPTARSTNAIELSW